MTAPLYLDALPAFGQDHGLRKGRSVHDGYQRGWRIEFGGLRDSHEVTKSAMAPGGYYVFDDATVSSCIGATEVIEDIVVARYGLQSEQIYPHFVFRHPAR
jgi:hypothetical protein